MVFDPYKVFFERNATDIVLYDIGCVAFKKNLIRVKNQKTSKNLIRYRLRCVREKNLIRHRSRKKPYTGQIFLGNQKSKKNPKCTFLTKFEHFRARSRVFSFGGWLALFAKNTSERQVSVRCKLHSKGCCGQTYSLQNREGPDKCNPVRPRRPARKKPHLSQLPIGNQRKSSLRRREPETE